MASDAPLEETISTVLTRAGGDLLASLSATHEEAQASLEASRPALEAEYDRIASEASKEADKVKRQLTGAADLEARNAQLRLVEGAIERVFEEASSRIRAAPRDGEYSRLIAGLVSEAAEALGTTEIVFSTSAADREAVSAAIAGLSGAEVAAEPIECMGGVRAVTRDGSTSFDNTLDARVERLKPLIRKEIAARFGLGG
ncbi:MAG: V-type ATP synthase subunit E family protein [Thaumarchaeota archaeon]|nr:V-type ATP synthase subunit E family protein [Nitrososphaerota archaeon]MDD9808857.1 V-type ATP synthase subunit E family protein [Nitrososphaerota archaeon]MDD9814079.1 V-type ATP synthase subunit E family protein [Nitrososphaerota archaeon]MDD9825586.1 V-type ATP synthase subunit E family protein [Nitrososphaerota archaeon]MDD9842899.1 V-type ATP synthase subunit E family protein [Nitrososphaerota archaeon]